MKNKKITGIYEIRWMGLKSYIGSSKDVKSRMLEHLRTLKRNKHHSKRLQRSWNKYGPSGFAFRVVEECDYEQLYTREQYWIEQTGAAERSTGYNMLPNAGTVSGHTASQETRDKMSIARRGVLRGPASEIAKKKMSEAKRGKKLSESHVESMRRAATGRKHTPDSIEKMRRVQKRRAVTEVMRETRRALNIKESSHIRLKKHLEENGLVSPNQKLTQEDVTEIKKLISDGLKSSVLAKMYHVNRSTIYRAVSGATSHERGK